MENSWGEAHGRYPRLGHPEFQRHERSRCSPSKHGSQVRVIHQHILFNAITSLASWLTALLVVLLYLAVDDWKTRPRPATLEDALRGGESQTIEFKAGRPDVPLKKAIAGFANTNSGTIFIG